MNGTVPIKVKQPKEKFDERDLLTERKKLEQSVMPVTKGDKERVRKDAR